MNVPFVFQIMEPAERTSFVAQLDELAARVEAWLHPVGGPQLRLVQARVYLSDIANWEPALTAHPLYVGCLARAAVSVVGQPPLSGAKVALQLCALPAASSSARREGDAFVFETGGVTFLWQTVRLSAADVAGLDAAAQTRLAFDRHVGLLAQRGWTLAGHCLRTWLFVRDIDRHYAGVVAGRNAVFAREGLTPATHFIASTGIGGETAEPAAVVAVDFLSASGPGLGEVSYLQAPDYLNPTYEYGVAFERATAVGFGWGRMVLLSGTASIDKTGTCVHRGDVLTQTGRLLLNMEKLLEAGGASLSDLLYVVVYLRDVSDYAAVARYMSLRFPRLPVLITEARVCRPEWLVEMEGVAAVPAPAG